jgi:hypothetical protein
LDTIDVTPQLTMLRVNGWQLYAWRDRSAASFRRLAALDVETACFGHGDPIVSGAGGRIRDAVTRLGDA